MAEKRSWNRAGRNQRPVNFPLTGLRLCKSVSPLCVVLLYQPAITVMI